MECVFSRTRKSLEHLKRQVEILYKEVFEPWFVSADDARESQITIVKTAASVWAKNPTRCLLVIEKLWQMGIVTAESGIDWALKSLKRHSIASLTPDYLEFKVIKLLFDHTLDKPLFLSTLYQ